MDLILRNCRLPGNAGEVDIGVSGGRIAAIAPALAATAGEEVDAGGRLVSPGFVEAHIHLDKACILGRCGHGGGGLAEAIGEVARLKRSFTPEDVYARGVRALTKAILNGTMHVRTHVEVDPVVGLRGLEGVRQLARDYAWAADVEICVFPQEGLLNNPGTAELMVAALESGATVVGGAPYTDSDPGGQIDRIFALARQYDVDIDLHLDFSLDASHFDLDQVCALTERQGWGGRVAVGHVTKLSAVDSGRLAAIARRMADAGVALTVLPATDLFLMGRGIDHDVPRGVAPAHRMLPHGVNCCLATNNLLNPFTPFGDGSLIRMANLYANACQVDARDDMLECFAMITERPARLMRIADYGIAVGGAADLVILDAPDRATALAELAQPLIGFKRGRRTFTRAPAELHPPA